MEGFWIMRRPGARLGAAALASLLLISLGACAPRHDKKKTTTAATETCTPDAYTSVSGQLNIRSTKPSDCGTSVALSLSTVTVTFDQVMATTYDAGSFSYPHLADVKAYLVLEDLTSGTAVDYFLDLDFSDAKTVDLFLKDPPIAQHQYRLRAIAGLATEAGATLPADRTVTYTLGGSEFGGGVFANRVIDYSPEVPAGSTLGQGRYVSASILGQPEGSLHVTSLGDNASGEGGSVTVGFGDAIASTPQCIVDGVGDDFTVIENVFTFTDDFGPQNYTEAAFVEVSQDGSTFYRFAHTEPSSAADVGNPAMYTGLAGINVDGDSFDLATVIAANALPSDFKACYVRIVDAGTTVLDYDHDGEFQTWDGSGADIDAVEAIHAEAAPGQVP